MIVRSTIFLITLVIVASSAVALQGELIAWDSFANAAGGDDYNLGPLQYQNPTMGLGGFIGPWNNGTRHPASATGNLTHELSPGIHLEGLIVPYTSDIGWANRRLSRAIDYTPTDGKYYMSALLRKNHTTDGDLAVGLAPLESTSWSFSNVRGTYIGFEKGSIDFLTADTLNTLVPTSAVNIGETYFAMMQYDYSTSGPDTITAKVYDGSSTEIASHTFTGLDLDGDIGRLGFIVSDLPPTVFVDEWRFGTELSDVMVVPPNGDFDGDGDVDGVDFLAWQQGESPNSLSQSDLTVWRENYGTMVPTVPSAVAVPEPASVLLVVAAALLVNVVVARIRMV